MERSHGGMGRASSHGNGRGVNQVSTVRTQQERQEEEWSVPANIERREDERERCESSRAPPAPSPTEDQFFTDWSSMESPRERMSQCDDTARESEHNINQPDNQADHPGSEPTRSETRGDTLGGIVILSSTH